MIGALLLAALVSGVEVRAEPPVLRLDSANRAELTFRAADGDLRVECSAGAVTDLRRSGSGEWKATWHAPRTRLPQVALIVARSGDAVGFVALPLWGQGEAEVRTRPGAVVDVRIGPETFGPMRADKDGRAFVPVVVPPGVDFAEQGLRHIDLKVPRTRTVQLAPLPPEVEIDRDREVEVAVAAVTRTGAPLEGAALDLSAWRGEITDLVALAPGLYRATWHVPAGAPGAAVVAASVAGDPEASEAAVRLVAGVPEKVILRAAQDRIEAGGAAIDLSADAFDANGNVTTAPVVFTASAGALTSRAAGPGRYALRLEPPGDLGGAEAVTVTAAARRTGNRAGAIAIAAVAGAPARVELVPERRAVVADGRGAVQVRVVVRDRYGNEAPAPPTLSADTGQITPPVQEGREFVATFVPPLLHDPGDANLEVRAGGAEGHARLRLRPRVRELAVSLRTGVFSDLHGLTAPLIGLEGALRKDALGVQLALLLDLSWAGARQDGAVGAALLDSREDFLIATAGGAVRLPIGDRVVVWGQAAAGLVAAAASVRVSGTMQGDATSRGAEPALELGAGIERRMWGGAPFLELRWLRTRPFSLPNLDGSLTALTFCAGYRVEML